MESIKKRGVFLSSLSRVYDMDDTQSLPDLSTVQNEKLFHQDRVSRRESMIWRRLRILGSISLADLHRHFERWYSGLKIENSLEEPESTLKLAA